MDIFDIIDTLSGYGADIAIFSALTCAAVQILKRTLLKNCQKKVLTFLPFALGALICAVFAAAVNADICYPLRELPAVCERGFAVGSLSTLIYVWYEQFIRAKDDADKNRDVIATLIEGYVPADEVKDAAKSIAGAIERDVTGDGATRAEEILLNHAGEGISKRDAAMLAKLIIETLAHLNGRTAQ